MCVISAIGSKGKCLPNVFIGMVINDVNSVILVRSAIYNMHD